MPDVTQSRFVNWEPKSHHFLITYLNCKESDDDRWDTRFSGFETNFSIIISTFALLFQAHLNTKVLLHLGIIMKINFFFFNCSYFYIGLRGKKYVLKVNNHWVMKRGDKSRWSQLYPSLGKYQGCSEICIKVWINYWKLRFGEFELKTT